MAPSRTKSTAPKPAAADAAATEADCFEVCLVAPREGFALVSCGNARFCNNVRTGWLLTTIILSYTEVMRISIQSCKRLLNSDTYCRPLHLICLRKMYAFTCFDNCHVRLKKKSQDYIMPLIAVE